MIPFCKVKDLTNTHVFRFCLSVLLEQDAYDPEEIKEATRIISELTNHEEGFNITSKEVS